MKLTLIISIIQLLVGCGSFDKSNNIEDSNKSNARIVITSKDILNVFDSLKTELSQKTITIRVGYAHISCSCAQWFDIKYKKVPFLEGVERFYLEPTDTSLLNANNLWDGEHLPLILKVTGTFSKEKLLPRTYGIKGEPEKARIFLYNKITVVSPSSDKDH